MLAVLLLLAVGVAVGRARLLPDGAAAVLDAAVIRLALPGLILAEITRAPLGLDAVVPVAVAWVTLAVLALLIWIGGRILDADRRTVGTLLVVIPLGNTSFLGYPAVAALLGQDRLALAVVYDQLGTFLALATYASVIASRYGRRAAPSVYTSRGDEPAEEEGWLRALVRFPPFIALVAALALRPFGLPADVQQLAELLGRMVVPLAMLAIGMRLRVTALREQPLVLAVGLGLRMVLAPALVLAAAVVLGAGGVAWEVSALQAAMPPMVTAAVVAAEAGLDERLAVGLAGVGVIVAMATLPLWAAVLPVVTGGGT